MAVCENCFTVFEPATPRSSRRNCSRSCAVALSWKNPATKAARKAGIAADKRSPEAQKRLATFNQERWARPGERERLSDQNRREWSDPKARSGRVANIKKAHARPALRQFYSDLRKALWADPEVRARMTEGVRIAHSTPEARAKFSALLSARWRDPQFAAKMVDGIRAVWTPERRAAYGKMAKDRWANDSDYRALLTALAKARAGTPEFMAANKARMDRLWADPEWRARNIAAVYNARWLKTGNQERSVDLVSLVNKAVPRALPDFAREEICQDLLLQLLEGTLKREDLRDGTKETLKKYNREFPDKYGPLSLDAPIHGTDGLTIMDTLAYDHARF
jgi:hypothetical protein